MKRDLCIYEKLVSTTHKKKNKFVCMDYDLNAAYVWLEYAIGFIWKLSIQLFSPYLSSIHWICESTFWL